MLFNFLQKHKKSSSLRIRRYVSFIISFCRRAVFFFNFSVHFFTETYNEKTIWRTFIVLSYVFEKIYNCENVFGFFVFFEKECVHIIIIINGHILQ